MERRELIWKARNAALVAEAAGFEQTAHAFGEMVTQLLAEDARVDGQASREVNLKPMPQLILL